MEVNYLNLFYMGIAYDNYPEKGKKPVKTGLPVKKLGREFPYLLGQGRAMAGRMLIYYALLPEYGGKNFLTGKPKRWKKEYIERIAENTRQRAAAEWGCREQLFSPELGGDFTQVPPELLAVYLYQFRPFERLAISLPDEGGEQGVEQVMELITPYLPRMRQVMFIGEENLMSEKLEDYLYGEYGIIMARGKKVPSDFLWLDLGEEKTKSRAAFKENSGRISPGEAWKFLDTTVKNGYNT